jgi:hypothetical protein
MGIIRTKELFGGIGRGLETSIKRGRKTQFCSVRVLACSQAFATAACSAVAYVWTGSLGHHRTATPDGTVETTADGSQHQSQQASTVSQRSDKAM